MLEVEIQAVFEVTLAVIDVPARLVPSEISDTRSGGPDLSVISFIWLKISGENRVRPFI